MATELTTNLQTMDIRSFLADASGSGEMRLILTTDEQLERAMLKVIEKAFGSNKQLKEEPAWLSPAQVCKQLDIDRSTLWRWSKEGYLPGTKFGNRVRYKLSDVERIEKAEK